MAKLSALDWSGKFLSGSFAEPRYPKSSKIIREPQEDVFDWRMFRWSENHHIEVGLWEALDENDSILVKTEIYDGFNFGISRDQGFRELIERIRAQKIDFKQIKKFRFRHTHPSYESSFSNGDVINAFKFKFYLESMPGMNHISHEVSILYFWRDWRGKTHYKKRAYVLE